VRGLDAQIKLSVVASDVFGTSGQAMMAALIDGQRDPKILAQLARSSLRRNAIGASPDGEAPNAPSSRSADPR
jgi:hypothetical protein